VRNSNEHLKISYIGLMRIRLVIPVRKEFFVAALICLPVFLLTAFAGNAQQRRDWKSRIDVLVEKADSLSMKSQTMFYSERQLGNKQWIRETWYYTEENDRVVIFQVRYLLNRREITEAYYMDRNELICMEKIVAPDAAIYMDEIHSGELFFLENRSLRQYVSYGKKNTSQPYGDAQYNCLNDFESRLAELRRNIQIVKATRRS
jgi:hypothetical protein